MPALKLAVQTSSLRQPLKQALRTANGLGVGAVEIDARRELKPDDLSGTALRQFRKLLDDLNLRISAVRFQTRRGYDVEQDLEARIAGTKAAMRMAQSLGCHVVVNQVGRVPEKPEGPAWTTMLQSLSDIGRYGQHYGALLAAETGTESGPDLARLIAALPDGSLGADLNPGNLIVNGFSAAEAVEALGPNILHVHATDGVNDLARGRGIETQLGRGSADFPNLLGILEQHDYRGYITISRPDSDDPLTDIQRAVKYLRSL